MNLNLDRSGRYTLGSYQSVPLEIEAPVLRPLPQHGAYLGDARTAPAAQPQIGQPTSDSPGLHNGRPVQSLDGSLEPDPKDEEATGSSTAASDKDSSRNRKRDKRKERREKWKATADRLWLWELLSATFSLACFVALVVVLRRSDGKEQTRWLFGQLTLNGLIALLSTFIRAAMMLCVGASLSQMKWNQYFSRGSQGRRGRRLEDLDTFEQASRGPLGSLKLLVSRSAPHLGLIGAVITISTLAFDAFAQEVVQIRYDNMPRVHGTAIGNLVRSEKYDAYTKLTQESNYANDLNTVAAEYNGIFNYQNITAPVAQCSTGNCTWPIVPSLAVCGSCTDVTSALNYSCVGITNSDDEYLAPTNCTFTLSDGGVESPYTDYYTPGYTFWTSSTGRAGPEDGLYGTQAYIAVRNYRTQHYNESSYAYLETWLMINAGLEVQSVTATTCGLWFCVQAYETSVSNGIPNQKIIGIWSETDINPDIFGQGIEWVNFTDVPEFIRLNATYSVGTGALMAFGQQPIVDDGNATYGFDSLSFYDYSSTTVRALMSIVDYNAWIELFALGMSNNVRSTGISTIPASTYAGKVLTSIAHVHVRWPWLAFPAAMVVASLFFLAACIWQTHHLHVPPWKGDALALLLTGVDEDIQAESASRWKVAEEKVQIDISENVAVFRKVVAREGTFDGC